MTTQLELEPKALARVSDPDTSHAAAKAVSGATVGGLAVIALAAFKANPLGLTNHELVAETQIPWQSITPRIRPLVRAGLICDSGQRRPGPTGKKCIVWRMV